MSAFTIEPLNANFGAQVSGVDIGNDVDADTLLALSSALYEHMVLVIREQSLTEPRYLGFGRKWGEPIPHVLDHMRMPGYPELMTVGNTEERDKNPLIRNGAAQWHTDQSYEQVPASATMLYSILAPSHGGETQFCNMRAAYAALDDATRARLDTLQVAHKYGKGKPRADELPINPITSNEQEARVPVTWHPLVMPHPVTGSRALYALGHGAHGIKGMAEDDAEALIEQLKTHCAQERFIYRHRYSVGDVVIWDTLQTMHRATPIEVPSREDDSRLLWRISVRGRPGVHPQSTAH